MKKVLAISTLFAMIALVNLAHAVVPELIPVQGVLTDDQDVAIDGATDLTFGIFAAETGGAALWSETQTGVDVNDGFFTAYLGDSTAIDASVLLAETELWLEITVDSEALSRVQLGSVPFAFECLQIGSLVEEDIQPILSGSNGCTLGTVFQGWDDTTDAPICVVAGGPVAANFEIADSMVAINSTSAATIMSGTITIPAAGYVFVNAVGDSYFSNDGASNTVAQLIVYLCTLGDTSSTSYCGSSYNMIRLMYDASNSANDPFGPIATSRSIYFDSAGQKTIYLNGSASASDTINVYRSKLTMIYVPALTP